MNAPLQYAPDSSPPPPLPSLPVRLVQVIVAPARLFDALRERPVWFAALLVGALAVMAGIAVIPPEVWNEMVRAQMLDSGQEVPAEMANMGNIYRVGGAVAGLIFWFASAFVFSGILAGVFAFVLGDRISYRQMLSGYAHASLVAAFGSLLVAPLRVIQRDPQLTLSLGTFLSGVEGYAGAFLGGLDLFGLWCYFLLGLAVTRFDSRRSLGVAVGITMGFFLAFVAIAAMFQA